MCLNTPLDRRLIKLMWVLSQWEQCALATIV